jgi:hypothetical protein
MSSGLDLYGTQREELTEEPSLVEFHAGDAHFTSDTDSVYPLGEPVAFVLPQGDVRHERASFRRGRITSIPEIDTTPLDARKPVLEDFLASFAHHGLILSHVATSSPKTSGWNAGTRFAIGCLIVPVVLTICPREVVASMIDGRETVAARLVANMSPPPPTLQPDFSATAAAPGLPPAPPGSPAPIGPTSTPQPTGTFPDSTWQGLSGRSVEVVRADGSFMRGQVAGFDPSTITLISENGSILVIQRQEVVGVKITDAANEPVAGAPVAGAPATGAPATGAPVAQQTAQQQKLMSSGKALIVSGNVIIGLGSAVAIGGLAWAIYTEYPLVLAYAFLPGMILILGVGVPMIAAGGALKKKARGLVSLPNGAIEIAGRNGNTKLRIRPSGPSRGWGGGLALQF